MLQTADLCVILGYLVLFLALGWRFRHIPRPLPGTVPPGSPPECYTGFFAGGRRNRWWWIGGSLVATTFASDTPLVISGWVAKYGISASLFWWGGVLGTMAMTIFFAARWRQASVLTDAELVALRYGGDAVPTRVLRTVKAFVSGVVVNSIVMGWILAAMAKIVRPLVSWKAIVGEANYALLDGAVPAFLRPEGLDTSLTILALLAVVLVYSLLGGLRAVLVANTIQVALAIAATAGVALFAVFKVGGLSRLWAKLEILYPSAGEAVRDSAGNAILTASQVAAFVPDLGGGIPGETLGMPVSALLLSLGFLWWTHGAVDGSGYAAQQFQAAQTPADAEYGSLLYAVGNFVLRHWPWIAVALVGLVLYPRQDYDQLAQEMNACMEAETCTELQLFCAENPAECPIRGFTMLALRDGRFVEDREMAIPTMMRDVLPPGMLGFALVAMFAAFMSSVASHVNWGASYIAVDLYSRWFQRKRRLNYVEQRLVARLSCLAVAALSLLVAAHVDEIGTIWEFYGGMMAGMGIPHLLRWFWWRTNAWTELSGLICALSLSVANWLCVANGLGGIFPESVCSHPTHAIALISLVSGVVCVVVTFATSPCEQAVLERFVAHVRPMGFWRGIPSAGPTKRRLLESLFLWLMGTGSIYAGLFGAGFVVRAEWDVGAGLLAFFLIGIWMTVKGMKRLYANAPNYRTRTITSVRKAVEEDEEER